MRRIALLAALSAAPLAPASGSSTPPPANMPTAPVLIAPPSPVIDGAVREIPIPAPDRGFLQSDHAFPGFIGPISAPILSKDPRSLTELRLLFVQNWFPEAHPLMRGGDAQIYAGQLRVALTDRLTFIADKDGVARVNANGIPPRTGLLNINAGLKYTFLRDVENQMLGAAGFTYEPPTGEAKVFQNHGAGVGTVFGTFGKELGCWHVLANASYQFGINSRDNSSFGFAQLHIDRQMFGWLYPLAEVNFYRWSAGGDRGVPNPVGEFDGLINLGTTGVAGNSMVTAAVGLKAVLSQNVNVGVAWEAPLGRKDFMLQRVLVELILRY